MLLIVYKLADFNFLPNRFNSVINFNKKLLRSQLIRVKLRKKLTPIGCLGTLHGMNVTFILILIVSLSKFILVLECDVLFYFLFECLCSRLVGSVTRFLCTRGILMCKDHTAISHCTDYLGSFKYLII